MELIEAARIDVPTIEEMMDLEGVADPGEQLVSYYSVAQRLNLATLYNYDFAGDLEPESSPKHQKNHQLGVVVLTGLNNKFESDWVGRRVHVEALDPKSQAIRTSKGRYRQDATGKLSGLNVRSRADTRMERSSEQAGKRMAHMLLNRERFLRTPDFFQLINVVDRETGQPLVHVEFL